MSDNTYQPAKVWTWEKSNGGAFANINRPVSGATHEKTLPVGKHPLQLYSLGTPNGQKVTIMLEELLAQGVKGAEYDAWIIRIGDGDQFSSGFVEVNPNSKIPALRDHSQNPPVRVFESGAILLYLAEKYGYFLPQDLAKRTETLNWLFWLQGAARSSAVALVTSIIMRRLKLNTRLIASPWKPSAYLTCWINS
jgi:GST-like protein